MAITLDDVSCLLYIPMTGKTIDHVPSLFDREAMKIPMMTHLGIPTYAEVATNKHKCQNGVGVVDTLVSPIC